jgi:3-oxoacyl-[acyl-carrier-protein] synthase III
MKPLPRHAAIHGTGRYVPERALTGATLEEVLGEPIDGWLRASAGIAERRVMAEGQGIADLCVEASRIALDRAEVDADELDLILVASDAAAPPSPGTASEVQRKLGAVRAGTFDVSGACSSWVTALHTGAEAIASDRDCRRVLIVGACRRAGGPGGAEPRTAAWFGDGAGAVVLGESEEPGVLAAHRTQDGAARAALDGAPGGLLAERGLPLVRATLATAQLSPRDVSLFLFTQLDLRTVSAVLDALELPHARAHGILDEWGYTGAAYLPMALDDAYLRGRLQPGDVVMMCAGGAAMAAAAIRWT